MARLIGGIGASHAPSIAYAFDAGHCDRPEWKPFFDAFHPVKDWIGRNRVDTLVVFYNDHLNRFQLDAYPTFAIGLCESMPPADEGRGARPLPPVPGDPRAAAHIARSLVEDEFDLTLCQQMELDHGVLSILPLITDPPWTVRVIPIAVNVIVEPLPTPMRCWRIGQAAGRAIRSLEGDSRVVVMATGGLSHQLHGQSFGFTNPDWDHRFLDLLESNPERLAQASHADFIQRGGAESVEMMVWLAMRGALAEYGGSMKRVQRHYYAPMLTGYGLVGFELEDTSTSAPDPTRTTTHA